MTASDTALSRSASPDPGSGVPAPESGWPEAEAPRAATGRRPESYRRLWQPPGRRPAHRQALGQPYVWAGTDQPEQADLLPTPTLPRATADRAAILPAGPIRGDAPPWRSRDDEPSGRPGPRAELEYPRLRHGDPLTGMAAPTERAVIGDLLRVPIAWCQSGTCIAWHSDPAALGEADVRARAIASGWCLDAFGQLICPACQQRYHVWSARPLVPRTGRLAGPDPRAARAAGGAGRHRRQY